MPENINQHPTNEQIADLQDSVASLSQEVQVLRDILDEIREDFSWALRNGHSKSEDNPQHSILKKMALDPSAEDWQDRLEIVNGTEAEEEVSNDHDKITQTDQPNELNETEEGIQEEIEQEELKVEPEEKQPSALLTSNLQQRIEEHDEWAETIRDPACEKSEGLRTLRTKNGWANAEYEIAPLPDGRWAIRISLAYHCGDHQGSAIPWVDFDSRDECIENFLIHAKRFFGSEIDNGGSETQRIARVEMLKHFEETLFGFQEPELREPGLREPEVIKEENCHADETPESHEGKNLQSLKHEVLEYLADHGRAVNLQDIRFDLCFADVDSIDPLADDLHRALSELRNSGNVTVIETDFGDPDFLFQRPLFLRPDRQSDFGGTPYYEWAEAKEDRDTLTVDRVGDNGDGGEHRFTVKRGDTVEAFFSRDKQEVGKVVGISHARREVRVAFRAITNGQENEGTWFAIGSIYPAVEATPNKETVPLSSVIEQVNQAHTPQGKEWSDADRVESSNVDSANVPLRDSPGRGMESLTEHHRLYTLDDFQAFLQQLNSENLTAAKLQESFLHLNSSRGALIHDLVAYKNAKELRALASRFGCLDAKRNTKQQNAESIVRSMMLTYTLKNSVTYQPFSGETYEDAIIKVVESITDEMIQEQIEEQNKKTAEVEKSLTNPETFQEFRQFVQSKGESELSHQQLIKYDKLRAEQTRLQRANKKTATVEQFNGDIADLEITIKAGFHSKKEISLWICQLSERIDKATFTDLKMKAKQLGGWWSSFKKDDAGFQFKSEESAQKFQSLLQGNADRSDELADRKTRKIESASERLTQLADDLEQSANESLHQDRQTNTVRRSEMAAGIRGRAYLDIAFAGTMRSLATDLASGEAIYLDGIRTKTQLQTIIDVLRRAKRMFNEKLLKEKGELGVWERHNAVEELGNRPMVSEDADFAEYPYPSVYKRNFEDVIQKALHRKGVMLRAKKMQKQIAMEPEFIQFKEEYEIKQFAEFCTRCKDVGIDVQWLESSLDDYKRLHAANIHSLPELRMALRELVPHLQKRQEDDPVLKAEQALIGKKLDSFFPTPKPIISRMLELADIQKGDRVLEPSAGKGDILDMLRLHHPENEVIAIEHNGTLFDVLEAKGHNVTHGDFLEHQGEYNQIIMNPPFEKKSDMAHVRHAFSLLIPNGRLIAIMSEGPFFRSDTQATEFRNWLDELGGESEQLPEDAFNSAEAFRKTGVRTRIVTLIK